MSSTAPQQQGFRTKSAEDYISTSSFLRESDPDKIVTEVVKIETISKLSWRSSYRHHFTEVMISLLDLGTIEVVNGGFGGTRTAFHWTKMQYPSPLDSNILSKKNRDSFQRTITHVLRENESLRPFGPVVFVGPS